MYSMKISLAVVMKPFQLSLILVLGCCVFVAVSSDMKIIRRQASSDCGRANEGNNRNIPLFRRSLAVNNSITPQIAGGTYSSPNRWPWMAALLDSSRRLICGGSLISPRYVLTAAHCVPPASTGRRPYVIRLGTNNIRRSPDGLKSRDVRVEKWVYNRRFRQVATGYDIALVKMKENVEYTRTISPVCLPTRQMGSLDNQRVVATGWGSIRARGRNSGNALQEVNMIVIGAQQCGYGYSILCARGERLGGGVCNGDSGGPLVYRDRSSGRYTVVGISSAYSSVGCGTTSLFTRVQSYLNMIESTVKK